MVVVHPEYGLLVIEVKAGAPRRERNGEWFIGSHPLERSPFKQAEDAKHDLRRAIEALPDWPSGHGLRAGHAVAFPDVDLASLPKGHTLLGPDTKRELVLDADAFATPEATRRALERRGPGGSGDGSRGYPLTPADMARIDDFLRPTVELRRLLRHDVDEGTERLHQGIEGPAPGPQPRNRSQRRVEVVGPAGSGKSLVAVEKACRLAREGWRTLLRVLQPGRSRPPSCARSTSEASPPISTADGHDLPSAGEVARHSGRRPSAASPADPAGLVGRDRRQPRPRRAIDLPTVRYDAIVVDEGQDFSPTGCSRSSSCCSTPTTGSCGCSMTRGRRCDRR